MNKNLLLSKIKVTGDNQNDLALVIGLSAQRLSAKINDNDAKFTQSEIQSIKNHYQLTNDEVIEIFFEGDK